MKRAVLLCDINPQHGAVKAGFKLCSSCQEAINRLHAIANDEFRIQPLVAVRATAVGKITSIKSDPSTWKV